MSHRGKLVVVTGASRGVGREAVMALVRDHGCTVLAIARDNVALQALAAECKGLDGRLEPLELDLVTDAAPRTIERSVGNRRLHALVNNAGHLVHQPFGSWSREDLDNLFAINVLAPIRITQAIIGRLAGDPPGHIVNIGSMGGFQGSAKFSGLLAYSASKAALANATECMAEELKDQGIRANCLCIGAVDTDMLRRAFPGYAAQTSAAAMGNYIARFALEGHNLFNGKVLPVAVSTP